MSLEHYGTGRRKKSTARVFLRAGTGGFTVNSHELENRSSIGALFVDRSGDGSLLPIGNDDYNRTYAIDGRWGIGEKIDLGMWAAKTEDRKSVV